MISRSVASIFFVPILAFVGVCWGSEGPRPGLRRGFPIDAAVLDARRDLGAVGDGKADDTEALQRGLDASCGLDGRPTSVLFLPNGVYRVTRTLVVKGTIGPWMVGESRDGVIIRLDDHVVGCNAVLRSHPNDGGGTSADWFMRNVVGFTIDAGDNPATDGIRYFANNSGMLADVRVVGNGPNGVNSSFMGQNGPNLIQDVAVEGFETGLLSQWFWGQTLSRVRVGDCRKQGVFVSANALGIEDLVVERTPIGLVCDFPDDWTWWGGVVAIVGGRFRGGDPDGPAVRNRGVLYARDLASEGFGRVLLNDAPGGSHDAPALDEFYSHEPKSLFDDPRAALALPVVPEPPFDWELDPAKWESANDHGAVAGDGRDDTDAIRAAIDAAALAGKSTVFLRGIGGPDPNCYTLKGEVKVHGSVRHVLGLGFGRILADGDARFVVDDSSAPIVKFQWIDAFGGPPIELVNRSKHSTMLVESCGVTIVGEGAGSIFATNCPSRVDLRQPGQKLWARQLNPEGDDDLGLVRNAGGDLWALGVKCEGRGVRFRTSNRGRTEILGMLVYGPGITTDDRRPIFEVDDSCMSVAGLREIAFDVPTYPVKVRERRAGESRTLETDREPGWIGWSLFRAGDRPTP